MWKFSALVLFALFLLSSCTSSRTYVREQSEEVTPPVMPPAETTQFTVFLTGNTVGASKTSPALRLLRRQLLAAEAERSALIVAGGALCCKLPAKDGASESDLARSFGPLPWLTEGYGGRIVLVPGEEEWDVVSAYEDGGGRIENAVETVLGPRAEIAPADRFPGPVEVSLTPDLSVIALNTQWWLAPDRIFGEAVGYSLREPGDFIAALREMLYEERDKTLLVVGHHPLRSNGEYAGRFSIRDHLTPLPIIGSLRPLYRRYIGESQDMADRDYRLLRRELNRVLESQEEIIYASAHERSLQLFEDHRPGISRQFIVSGSAGETDFVAPGGGAAFTSDEPGFAVLKYYDDGSVWLEMWEATADDENGIMPFRHRLKEGNIIDDHYATTPQFDRTDYRDSTATVAVNADYAKLPGILRPLAGGQNRDLWATPVTAPVLDPARFAGGLTPVRFGGGSQTTTLHLEGANGRRYIARSIDKTEGRGWSVEMQGSIARPIAQDQISILNPFGSLMVPPLASAVGVLHPTPELVYFPDDRRLGPANDMLTDHLVMIEERPDEDMSDVPGLGGATNVIGMAKLLREIRADNDHRVDARAYARARLLDMLIADHDRTSDNIRWAEYEPYELDATLTGDDRTRGKVYVPVPRDRDMAFMRINGLVPLLYKRFSEPTWQDFRSSYGSLSGLNQKPLPIDRPFTASLTLKDWQDIAQEMKSALTDSVLNVAVRQLPAAAYEKDGARIERILRERRDDLDQVATRYYGILARTVDVVGSDKHERFEVQRLPGGRTEVVMLKTTREGETRKELFRRTFDPAETREIRLYGLGGNDQFIVRGAAEKAIRLIAIGGTGEDVFADSSRVEGRKKRTKIYDTRSGTTVYRGSEARTVLRDDPGINHYDRSLFALDANDPIFLFGSGREEGITLGVGALLTRHEFRKRPFARQHRLAGSFATKSRSFNLRADSRYVDLWRGWDLLVGAGYDSPTTPYNFFGFGNETAEEIPASGFYEVGVERADVHPALARELFRNVSISFGPAVSYIHARLEEEDRGVRPIDRLPGSAFERRFFFGNTIRLAADAVDLEINPQQGFRFSSQIVSNADLSNMKEAFATLSSDLTLYLSPQIDPQITIATRIGSDHNFGEFPFFSAASLGGKTNLRGYRNTRFVGRSSLYGNADVRVEVYDYRGQLGFGSLGVLGFADVGRVWVNGEHSRTWHPGYGGGVWGHLFNTVLVSASYAMSPEDHTIVLKTGFQF